MGKERALITGGSVGIGAALADVFAAHGHDLILVSRNREKLEARGRAIHDQFGVDVVCLAEDLADPQGARRLHEAVTARSLDVHYLVNNAGVGLYGKFATTDLDAELKMIQLNVTSVVDLTKRFLPSMIARRSGRILNVASTAAFVPGPWMSVYYATKAFLLSFSQAIDYELKPNGITVTTLCPGPTESEFKVRAGSQRSRLFEAFVMDAPRVARVGYDGDDEGQGGGDSRAAEQADSDRRAPGAAAADCRAVAPGRAADGEDSNEKRITKNEEMPFELTRENAWNVLTEHTKGESLRKHALAVEAAVRGYARTFGEDEEVWGVVALLHDFDYEQYPELKDHPFRGAEILRSRGCPEFVIRAILSHGEHTNTPRESKLEHTLFACDEMAGFVTAAALVRPSKSVQDLEPASVMKRMKDKAFAKGVNRDDLRKGAEELGLPLEEHIANVIGFMRERRDVLGL